MKNQPPVLFQVLGRKNHVAIAYKIQDLTSKFFSKQRPNDHSKDIKLKLVFFSTDYQISSSLLQHEYISQLMRF